MSVPWTLMACTVLGIWLLFAPGVLGTSQPAANVAYIGDSLIITAAVIAMAEVARALRYLIVPIVLAAVLPWLLGGTTTAGQINALVVGLIVTMLAFPCGPKKERYGLWDRFVM